MKTVELPRRAGNGGSAKPVHTQLIAWWYNIPLRVKLTLAAMWLCGLCLFLGLGAMRLFVLTFGNSPETSGSQTSAVSSSKKGVVTTTPMTSDKNEATSMLQKTSVAVALKTSPFLEANGINLNNVKAFEDIKKMSRKLYTVLDDLRLKNEEDYSAKREEVQKAFEQRFSGEKIVFPLEGRMGSYERKMYVQSAWRTTSNAKGKEEVCLVILFDHGSSKKADQVLYGQELGNLTDDQTNGIQRGTAEGTVTEVGIGTHFGSDRPKDVPLPYTLIKVKVTKVEKR